MLVKRSMTDTIHDKIAKRLARKFGTEYKSDKGIDVVMPTKVIEVEARKNSLGQGIDQVQRSQKARYLAVPKQLKTAAIKATEGTGIGVMGPTGAIVKKASRKK